jgi:hypothetical protein
MKTPVLGVDLSALIKIPFFSFVSFYSFFFSKLVFLEGVKNAFFCVFDNHYNFLFSFLCWVSLGDGICWGFLEWLFGGLKFCRYFF